MNAETPLLDVTGLNVTFRIRAAASVLAKRTELRAVDDVSFTIGRGETLGLVGESGSGKSTTARALLRLVPASGRVLLDGVDIGGLSGRRLRQHRRDVQMVFQDPYSSLDPSSTVGESIAEPLAVHEHRRGGAANDRVAELLHLVGLAPGHAQRYPHEFSGGQRQRIAIARAIALDPKLVVCDEAVSALDVSTQNQIINLLEDLQTRLGTSYLFIAHDLGVVRHISRNVAVMYLGRLVEWGPTERVFVSPSHPYTKVLLDASPVADPIRQRQRQRDRLVAQGEPVERAGASVGCPFVSRCAHAMDVCRREMPVASDVPGGGGVRCHLVTSTDRDPSGLGASG